MHGLTNDVAWICVRSKDAQKQLARTSLRGLSWAFSSKKPFEYLPMANFVQQNGLIEVRLTEASSECSFNLQ